MVQSLQEESSASTASRALSKAIEALQAGQHDGRLPDGAQANALESIAWSLIGLLSQQTQAVPGPSEDKGRSLSEELQRRGFLRVDPQ